MEYSNTSQIVVIVVMIVVKQQNNQLIHLKRFTVSG